MSRRGTVAALLVAVLTVGAAAAAAATVPLLTAPVHDDGVISLLLLGSDTGLSRGGTPLRARADAFHLLFVSPDRRHATIVNVPRDSYVPVPGLGTSKINACLTGGPERCVATAESRWNLDIDGYLLSSFDGWIHAVDAVGGVWINVQRPLSGGGPDLSVGRQQLDGGEALTYARDRKNRPEGDFTRTGAQAELLASLHRQLLRGSPALRRFSEVLEAVRSSTVTDLSASTLLRYGLAATRLPPGNVSSATLPGSAGSAGAASVVYLSGRADALVADASDGRLRR